MDDLIVYTYVMSTVKLSENELNTLSKEVLIKLILNLQDNTEQLTKAVENLSEQIRIMNQRTYGRKTESAVFINQLQMDLVFNEAEALADENVPEPSLEEAAPRKPKSKGRKQEKLKKVTNHRDVDLTMSVEELNQKYGEGKWKEMPEEIVYKLEHHPASFEAITYHIHVYAKDDNQTIVRAPKPTELFPKSIVTPSLLASILLGKYVNAVPLYRLEEMFHQNDVEISRNVMANWVIEACEYYLQYFYNAIKENMMSEPLLHADETPFQVLHENGKTASQKSYMWVYRTSMNTSGPKAILYQYCKNRGHENPEKFLKLFTGTLVTDGYTAYHKLEKDNPKKFRVAGCWIHVKRKFATVVKANGKEYNSTIASTAVKKIQKIYHEEHKIQNLPPDEHLAKRQEILKPLVDDFFQWVRENQCRVDEASATGRGFTYALNQEKYLRVFLDDPSVPLDNNTAEISIRPFTIGRKNWMFADTERGAQASAIIYSIVETAKAYELRLYDYLEYLLEELPKVINAGNHKIPDRLFPWSEELPARLKKNYTVSK